MRKPVRPHFPYLVALLLLVSAIAFTACGPATDSDATAPGGPAAGEGKRPWMETKLTDVATGETFTIGGFAGKPVLVESFAVWCPTCTAQQREIGKLKELEGDSIVHISLDTDPNESEANIMAHLELNGFDWRYAVSPVVLTQALIDDYGLSIVNAPGAPVILICPDQSSRLLRRGVKTAADLAGEVASGCGQ